MDTPHQGYIEGVHYVNASTEGKRWWSWHVIKSLAGEQSKDNSYRFWQAVWNDLSMLEQEGLVSPWPELFHEDDYEKGEAKFFARFEVLDDYLVPKEPMRDLVPV